MQALYGDTLEFSQTRVVSGKPIIEHPTVKVILADMRMKLVACQLLN